MLTSRLLHPDILHGLAEAGHGAQVLIADGNFPLATRSFRGARRVYLNLAPDLVRVTDVLAVVATAIPIEAVYVMATEIGEEPSIIAKFQEILPRLEMQRLFPLEFYKAARSPDVALAIATGERRIYANIILTIGVLPLIQSDGCQDS